MTDLLLQIGLSNLVLSFALALVAWGVHATGKAPLIAHLLWALVLVKLVTPPLVTLPVLPGAEAAPAEAVGPAIAGVPSGPIDLSPVPGDPAPAAGRVGLESILLVAWGVGSVAVLVWSLIRVFRFNRVLRCASEVGPARLQQRASEIGERLGLRRVPVISVTSARISPMVWWIGARVRVVIPRELLEASDEGHVTLILAHELAHVRRRDHMVRWLEWLACVAFWWNPVAWWARRNLRINEEICCDELVLASLEPRPQEYANALMSVVELLAFPALRPPAMASEMNSGGALERRFTMIVSRQRTRKTPRWLTAGALTLTLGVLPLGVASAQDYEAVGERLGDAVRSGELTGEQARAMMQALRRASDEEARRVSEELVARERIARAEEDHLRVIDGDRMSAEEVAKRVAAMYAELESNRRDIERATAVREEFARAVAELEAKVAEGHLSKKDARLELEEMRRALGEHEERRGASEDVLDEVRRELRRKMAAGLLTEDEIREHLEGMHRGGVIAKHERLAEQYARAEAEMKAAVEAGRVSEREAVERLDAWAREAWAMDREHKKAEELNWEVVRRRLSAAVRAGKLSHEDAERMVEALRWEAAHDRDTERDKRRLDQGVMLDDDEAIRLIEEAVESGKMSRIEASRKLDTLARQRAERERMAVLRERYDVLEARIKAGVEAGRLSAGEAERMLDEARLEMFGGDR